MTTAAIIESGMTFGPYPAGQCFYIEKSQCYSQVQNGVQMAEFLLLKQQQSGPTIWIVEAKSSCPRNLTAYIDDIRIKLTNAFLLGVAACLGRHGAITNEPPSTFKALNLTSTQFRFVLVVKGVPDNHLSVLRDALASSLKPLIKLWAISPTSIVVLNENTAKRHGLIL